MTLQLHFITFTVAAAPTFSMAGILQRSPLRGILSSFIDARSITVWRVAALSAPMPLIWQPCCFAMQWALFTFSSILISMLLIVPVTTACAMMSGAFTLLELITS